MLMAEVEGSDWPDQQNRTIRTRIREACLAPYRFFAATPIVPLISSCFSGFRRREDGDSFTSLQDESSFRISRSQRSHGGSAYILAASTQQPLSPTLPDRPERRPRPLNQSSRTPNLSDSSWDSDSRSNRSITPEIVRSHDLRNGGGTPEMSEEGDSLQRSRASTTPGRGVSSPSCMEPATTYVGGEGTIAMLPERELDTGMRDHAHAFQNTWSGSTMDADLALAIALQAEEEEEEARAMQDLPPPFIGVHRTYKELPCFVVEGCGEAGASGSENQNCIICLCDYVDGDEVRLLPCLHRFHVACIDPWLESSHFCPSCKLSDALQHLPDQSPACRVRKAYTWVGHGSVTTGKMQEETPLRRAPNRTYTPSSGGRPRSAAATPQRASGGSTLSGHSPAAAGAAPASAGSRGSNNRTPPLAARR